MLNGKIEFILGGTFFNNWKILVFVVEEFLSKKKLLLYYM